ncbi:TonB-dependent receptor [Occallatibacter savannae]|uniref:TonB-dependent receptor n=1 Tax=Occallatibacter savannae TaxID=1002691 RepID=UPI000D69BA77|nr:carboxypeptidase-like regulatory domain-containing protein [Occallatibacter savannae]
MRNLLKVLALAAVLTTAAGSAFAADTNGRIKGTVVDPNGAVLSGVKVSATNEATGVKFEATTGATGEYLFPQLPIGKYTVSVTTSGFKAFSAKGIVLNIDQEYVEPVKLEVGSTAEVVEVTAAAVQVDTTDMQLSNVVTGAQLVELPLIGRNFTALELTLPGVQASSDRFGTYSVSGSQAQQSSYLINGADSNDIALNTPVFGGSGPNLDALDQFNLIDGPLNAEYDRNSGGIVSATIKAGSNQFHGDAFEFYRDTFLNTANFFQHSITTGKPVVATFHQNIFGGTAGGPVIHDKLFFFGAYQGTRQVVPQGGGNVGVFFGNMLNGDFSADAGQFSTNPIPSSISIPGCSTAGETWADCAAANGGVFPASAFNPVAVALAKKYVPAPNSGTSFLFKPVVTTKNNQYIGRVDYALNPSNQFYGLFIIFKQQSPETLPFTGANVPGFGDVSKQSTNQITFDYVHQFNSTSVNDFAAHYTRFNFDAVEPQTPMSPASAGFAIAPENTKGAGLPYMSVNGLNGVNFALGFSTNGPQPRIDQVIQLDDSFSKIFGHHSLKFGYDGRRFNVSNPFSARNNGSYSFDPSTGTYSTGDGALDFLLGIPASYGQGSGAEIQASAFLNYVYGQDAWKVSNSFTLSYGLSYSIDTPMHNNQYGGEGIACLNPGVQSKVFTTAPLGIAYPGDAKCNNAGLATTRYSEFGPRLGFAWAPDLGAISGAPGKFSIRGGFGIYYNRTEEESSLQTLQTPPFGIGTGGAADFGGSPQFINPYADINGGGSIPNKFPYAFPKKGDTISADTWAALEPLDISTYDSSFRAPYAENFQLSIERELPSRTVARVSYVGSLGKHNQVTYEGNAETPAGHAACLAGLEYSPFVGGKLNCISNRNNQSLLFPQNQILGTIDKANQGIDPNTGVTGLASAGTVGSYASSNYHSLQASLEKAPTHGLLFQLSYTYSHAMDTGSSFENSGFGSSGQRGWNQWVDSLNYGDSLYDARHRLVFSPVYRVPQFSGSSVSFRNLALAGWEISGITSLATGFPYDISYAGTTSRSLWCSANWYFYACPDVPVQTAKASFGDPRVRQASGNSVYITNAQSGKAGFTTGPAAFQAEPIGQFGNVHRNPYHGPGINNTNMIVAKNFMLVPERNVSIQIRMESDNVFNHTQFNNPTSTVTSGNFGVITGAASARQTQLAAKVYF